MANTHTAIVKDIFPGGVKQAEDTYGLTSDPKAITVHWIKSPKEEVSRGTTAVLAGASAVNAAWIIIFIISVFQVTMKNDNGQSEI